jgi:hypothetical protein
MSKSSFAARSHIRNAVLCALATLTLAACGSEDGASSAAAAATTSSDTTVASTNVGMIDRSAEIDTSATPGSNTAASSSTTASTTASNTASSGSTASTTGTGSGTGSSAGTHTGTTTVGSGTTASTGNKSTAPVKSTTTSGVATLDWMPPTENTDGSSLTDLAGYTVYYGTSPNNLTQSVKVTNPGLTAYTVSDLPSGTWYFAVTSYSASGVESTRTSTISTTI